MIKFTITLIWAFTCALNVSNSHAQTMIDELQSQTKASDGMIRIECDSSIIALIGKPNGMVAGADFVERIGFRVQLVIWGGANAQKARVEADSKQTAIRSAFPELSTYLRYDAPNWKLLIGDCLTREEAGGIQQRLQKEFPQFGKEMYIVTDKIRLYIEH